MFVVQRCSSPYVVPMYGWHPMDPSGPAFIVCAYMQHRDLWTALRLFHKTGSGPLKEGWTVRARLALDVASGLAHLHARNVVHNDIASRNVLLGEGFRARLGDFGSAETLETLRKTDTDKEVAKEIANAVRCIVFPLLLFRC